MKLNQIKRFISLWRMSKENNSLLNDYDIETITEELSHFPNHVLARALIISTKFINALGFEDDLEDLLCLDKTNLDSKKYIGLTRELANSIYKLYLTNKDYNDINLNNGVH